MHSQSRVFSNCIHCSFHCNFKGKHEVFTWKDRETDTLCGQSLLHTFCTHTSSSSCAMKVINLKVKTKVGFKHQIKNWKEIITQKKKERGKPKESPTETIEMMLTEFKGKSNMITWSTSKSSPLAAKSVHTNVGQSPSSLLNFLRFSTLV